MVSSIWVSISLSPFLHLFYLKPCYTEIIAFHSKKEREVSHRFAWPCIKQSILNPRSKWAYILYTSGIRIHTFLFFTKTKRNQTKTKQKPILWHLPKKNLWVTLDFLRSSFLSNQIPRPKELTLLASPKDICYLQPCCHCFTSGPHCVLTGTL